MKWGVLCLLLLPSSVLADPWVVDWNHHFGEGPSNIEWAKGIVWGPGGLCAITGGFGGTIDFGGGTMQSTDYQEDVYLAVFDQDGNHLWSNRYGESGIQMGWSVAMDVDSNVVITGQFNGDIDFGGGVISGYNNLFVASFDPQGNHHWSYGTAQGVGRCVTADESGNVYVGGSFSGTVTFGEDSLTASGSDGFLFKFDVDGTPLWGRRYGDGNPTQFVDIAVDTTGGVIVVGNVSASFLDTAFARKYDEMGNLLWNRAASSTNVTSTGVVVDSNGNLLWTGSFGIGTDFGGGLLIPHYQNPATVLDVFIVKLDEDGNHLWSQNYGDESWEAPLGIDLDADDNLILSGTFNDSTSFGGPTLYAAGAGYNRNIFVAQLDNDGNHLQSAAYGDVSTELLVVRGQAVSPSGEVLLVGEFRGSLDFGIGPLLSSGGISSRDLFLVKLGNGIPVSTREFSSGPSTLGDVRVLDESINVHYSIGLAARSMDLRIYDVRGRMLRSLEQGRPAPGQYSRSWPLRDASGARFGAGVYFVRLRVDGEQFSRKFVVMH